MFTGWRWKVSSGLLHCGNYRNMAWFTANGWNLVGSLQYGTHRVVYVLCTHLCVLVRPRLKVVLDHLCWRICGNEDTTLYKYMNRHQLPLCRETPWCLDSVKLGGGTLWSIQQLNAKGQSSRYQGVSLSHAAMWRWGALGVLVCASVAWVCGWCVCAFMSTTTDYQPHTAQMVLVETLWQLHTLVVII